MTPRKRRTVVLDTSAFIAGFDPFSVSEKQYSVPAVEGELIENSMPWIRFKTAVDGRKLRLRTPKDFFLNRVEDASKSVGDALFLSEVDLKVLALALEQKEAKYYPVIVTDDYSIQNVANQIGVEFASLATFGIRYRFQWIRYCPACYRKYPSYYRAKNCRVCGTKLKRKPLKRTPVKR